MLEEVTIIVEDSNENVTITVSESTGGGVTKHSELTLDDGTNPHETTAADVGLGNVDNTSDLGKPISTATQAALDEKQDTLIAGDNITIVGNVISGVGTLPKLDLQEIKLYKDLGNKVTIKGTNLDLVTSITISTFTLLYTILGDDTIEVECLATTNGSYAIVVNGKSYNYVTVQDEPLWVSLGSDDGFVLDKGTNDTFDFQVVNTSYLTQQATYLETTSTASTYQQMIKSNLMTIQKGQRLSVIIGLKRLTTTSDAIKIGLIEKSNAINVGNNYGYNDMNLGLLMLHVNPNNYIGQIIGQNINSVVNYSYPMNQATGGAYIFFKLTFEEDKICQFALNSIDDTDGVCVDVYYLNELMQMNSGVDYCFYIGIQNTNRINFALAKYQIV